jgi:hypothetical protein
MRSSSIVGKAAWRTPAAVSAAVLALVMSLSFVSFASSAGASSTEGPSVSTGSAHPSGVGVRLEGSIDPNGEAATYYFQYGPTTAYGSQTTTQNLAAGTTKINVSQVVTGLLSGYHYRLVASNASGPAVDGHDRTYAAKKTKTKTKTKKTTNQETLKFTFTSKPPAEGQLVGSSLAIAGTLTGPGAAGHQVVLQSSPYPSGTAYGNVGAPQTVPSTGRFSFFVAHLSRSTRYRVAVVGPAPTYSQVITALATVRVTLHVRTDPRAGLVRLYGTVSPAVTDATVFFQVQQASKPHTNKSLLKVPKNQKAEEKAEEKAERAEAPKYASAFTVPVKRATRTMSRFSVVERIRKTGLYRAYVQVPKGPLASGHSSNIELHAAPRKKKH